MAQFNRPNCVFISNGEVFIADTENHRVRKVLWNGEIVTIAGNGRDGHKDGILATDSTLFHPHSVFVSSSNQVYISEMGGNRIRKIDQNGIISTIAGVRRGYNGDYQLAVNANLFYPSGLFVTDEEEVLFADSSNNRVRKIDRNGFITTIAGNGKREFNGDGQLATNASLRSPSSVFQYKNEIYIADLSNNRIRKIDKYGIISTILHSNNLPDFVHNDEVYFTDSCLNQIGKVLPNGMIKIIAGIRNEEGFNGDDKLATQCKLNGPCGIFVDNDSQVYFADSYNHCIRVIDQDQMMRRVIGTGKEGCSGDVSFDFEKYPHIGSPRKKAKIKTFPHAYHDLIVLCA